MDDREEISEEEWNQWMEDMKNMDPEIPPTQEEIDDMADRDPNQPPF